MILKKISFHNFRPFLGDQSVNLEPVNGQLEKNVTVILGDNTHGKSTFVLSFVWCLYGESRFYQPDSILNIKVENQMKEGDRERASVEIKFEDNGIDYIVKRTQRFTMCAGRRLSSESSEVDMLCIENGEAKSVAKTTVQIEEKINAILPKNLSPFFFFEGEKDNQIDRKDLGSSVRTLLGLEAYDNMRIHLYGSGATGAPTSKSVMGTYLEKQGQVSSGKAQEELKRLNKANDDLENVNRRLNEVEDQITKYTNKKKDIEEEYRQAAPTEEIRKERDRLQKQSSDLAEQLDNRYKHILKLFGRDSFALILKPLLPNVEERLEKLGMSDKGINGLEASAISELLARGKCLCGTSLSKGTPEYDSVAGYIDFLPPKSIGTLVRDLEDQIETYGEKANTFVDEFTDDDDDIQRIRTEIDENEHELRAATRRLGELGTVDIDDIEGRRVNCEQRIADLGTTKENLIRQQTSLTNERDAAERNFNKYKEKNSRAMVFQKYYKYAKSIYEWTNTKYKEEEKNLLNSLNNYIVELFNNMYTGKRDISVDDKYNVKVTYEGVEVADTGGLRVIKYFAYVASLVKLAIEVKDKHSDGDSIGVGGEYPLVLDAAFSHADATHTKNISTTLAGVASQLVFAVMNRDWEHAQYGIADKVCRKYELKKIDETEVHIEEVL